tara:strand:- start:45 stop:3269 length:3225 start_codon:yes stop_codon:yes gene_type:complete
MGDYLATIQKPHTVYDITPSKQYTWGDYKDFGNSLRTGFVKENLFAMAVANATENRKNNFQDVEGYNPYDDPQLADTFEDMGYFLHSGSPEETFWLKQRKAIEDQMITSSPGYITGRIIGGLTDPMSLLMFSKVGRVFFTGGRLARGSKVGLALGGEEMVKRKLDRARTLTESSFITAGGFVLPALFPGIANSNPLAKRLFLKFDNKADKYDWLDDAISDSASATFKTPNSIKKKMKNADDPFMEGTVGAAQIRKTFSEEELNEMEKIAKTGFGWLGESGPWTPILRTLRGSSLLAKETITKILENPLYQVKNFKNVASNRTIERTIARRKVQVFKAETEIEDLYKQYLQRKKKKVPKTRMGLYMQKEEEGFLTFTQFKKAIWFRRIGSKQDVPDEVIKGAEVSEKYIYSLGKEYDELGIPIMYLETQIQIQQNILKRGWIMKNGKKHKLSMKEQANMKDGIKQLEEKLAYMNKNGSLAKNYVNRVWLRDQLESRWDEFKDLVVPMIRAKNPELSDKAIEKILESIKTAQPYVRFDKSNNINIARNFRARELKLSMEDEMLLAEKGFIETDMFVLQRLYFNSVAPDIEITKIFGDPMMSGTRWKPDGSVSMGLKQIEEEYDEMIKATKSKSKKVALLKEKEQVIQDVEAARDLLRGTYGLPDNPQRSFSRGVRMAKLFNSMTMLTGALAAVPDIARILMTSGINRGFRTSWDMMTNVYGTEVLKLSRNQAYLSGEALDMVLGSRAMSMYDLENSFGVFNKLEKGISRTGNMYFTYINLMNPWNTLMKSWASAVNGTRILEEIENWVVKGKISKNNKAKLLNAGIDEDSAKQIWAQYQKHGLGKGANKADWDHVRIANTEFWDDGAKKYSDIFHDALGKDINITIVTPSKGEVPLWFNTEMGGVIVQFKKFAAAATQRMLLRGMQERDASFFGGVLMLLAAGAMVDAIRQRAFNRDYGKKPFGQKIVDAFDRSGIGGIFSDLNNVLERMSDNKIGMRPALGAGKPYSSWTSKNAMQGFGLFGPTSSQIANISDIMWDWGTGTHNHYTAKNVRRLIPFQNVWYLDSLFDQVEKGLR